MRRLVDVPHVRSVAPDGGIVRSPDRHLTTWGSWGDLSISTRARAMVLAALPSKRPAAAPDTGRPQSGREAPAGWFVTLSSLAACGGTPCGASFAPHGVSDGETASTHEESLRSREAGSSTTRHRRCSVADEH